MTGALRVEDGVFREVVPGARSVPAYEIIEATDLGGALVLPGLVDIHIHGAAGADFSDGKEEGLHRMARYIATQGVTGFLPTSMTLPREDLVRAFRSASQAATAQAACGRLVEARILGIHMEGPYLSKERCGVQNPEYLRAPDLEEFRVLVEASEIFSITETPCRLKDRNMLRLVDIAPEVAGAEGFVREVTNISQQRAEQPSASSSHGAPEGSRCKVAIAHTATTYQQACAAFDWGASHVTHLFNGMNPVHHRAPGVVGAAAEREHVTVELIADGYHVHPSVIRMAFRLFPGRICLVSDALRCCGMPDGIYELAGQNVRKEGGVARLEDGTIAGAATSLMKNLQNVISFGIPPEEAIRAATITPAKVAGWGDRIGTIEPGKHADFLVCDQTLNVKQVIIGGERV